MIAFDRSNPPIPVGLVVAVGVGGTTAVVLDENGDMREVGDADILVGRFDQPPGIEYGEWSRFHYQYRILAAAGLRTTQGHARWRSLATSGINPVRLWTIAKAIDYRGRSGFVQSIGDQVLEWLDTPVGKRQYKDPLSKRQWETLLSDPAKLLIAKDKVDAIMRGLDLKPLPDALKGAV